MSKRAAFDAQYPNTSRWRTPLTFLGAILAAST